MSDPISELTGCTAAHFSWRILPHGGVSAACARSKKR
jgi:hypothetical protein